MSYAGPDRDYATELEHMRYRAEAAEKALAEIQVTSNEKGLVSGLIEERDTLRRSRDEAYDDIDILRAKLAAAEVRAKTVSKEYQRIMAERDDLLRAKLAHTDKDYEALKGDLDAALARAAELEWFIGFEGYRACDIPACNCGKWHRDPRRAETRVAELEGALRETIDAIEALAPVAEGHFIGTVQWDAVDRARRVLGDK